MEGSSCGGRIIGVVDVKEHNTNIPDHEQPIIHQQSIVMIFLAGLLQKNEAMVHNHAHQSDPSHNGHHHRALQEIHAE